MTWMSAPECPFYNTNLSSNSIEIDNDLWTCNTLSNVYLVGLFGEGMAGLPNICTPKRTPLKA